MTDRPSPPSADARSPRGASEHAVGLATAAAEALADKKGLDTAVLDVADLLQITELFVVASGTSRPHVQTLVSAVEDRLRDDLELRPLRTEGREEGEWALLDFGSVVVHVFQPDTRTFYDLERLWADAVRVDVGEGSDRVAGGTD